ncbi:hypothetical protein AB0876_28570 [Mycobacterium sp. NPDC049093]
MPSILTIAMLFLVGCSDEVKFEKQSLDEPQTRSQLQKMGIGVPDNYSLVSMIEMPPPGSGSASYKGLFTSPLPISPVEVDGLRLKMRPTTCQGLQVSTLSDGMACATLSNLQIGGTQLAAIDNLTVISGQSQPGEARVYLTVTGH